MGIGKCWVGQMLGQKIGMENLYQKKSSHLYTVLFFSIKTTIGEPYNGVPFVWIENP